jgi:hypothetical protein
MYVRNCSIIQAPLKRQFNLHYAFITKIVIHAHLMHEILEERDELSS